MALTELSGDKLQELRDIERKLFTAKWLFSHHRPWRILREPLTAQGPFVRDVYLPLAGVPLNLLVRADSDSATTPENAFCIFMDCRMARTENGFEWWVLSGAGERSKQVQPIAWRPRSVPHGCAFCSEAIRDGAGTKCAWTADPPRDAPPWWKPKEETPTPLAQVVLDGCKVWSEAGAW